MRAHLAGVLLEDDRDRRKEDRPRRRSSLRRQPIRRGADGFGPERRIVSGTTHTQGGPMTTAPTITDRWTPGRPGRSEPNCAWAGPASLGRLLRHRRRRQFTTGTNASNAKWLANYTKSHAAGHIVSGVGLAVAGLCFSSSYSVYGNASLPGGRGPARSRWRPRSHDCLHGGWGCPYGHACGHRQRRRAGPRRRPAAILQHGRLRRSGCPRHAGRRHRRCRPEPPGPPRRRLRQEALRLQHHRGIALLAAVEFFPIALLLVWLVIAAIVQLRQATACPSQSRRRADRSRPPTL